MTIFRKPRLLDIYYVLLRLTAANRIA